MGIYWCEKYIIAICCIVGTIVSYKIGHIILTKKMDIGKNELLKWVLFSAIHMIFGFSYIIYICYSQYTKQVFGISVVIATVTLFGSLIFYSFKIANLRNLNELDSKEYEEKKKKQQEKVLLYAGIGAFVGLGLAKGINMTTGTLCIIILLFLLLMIACLPYIVYNAYYQDMLKKGD